MAATTQYNNERLASAKNAYCNAHIAGATIKKAYGTATIAANTEAASKVVLADKISSDSIIHTIKITNTAAGSTLLADNDVVICASKTLASPKGSNVLLADGVTLESALTSAEILGKNISGFDRTKSLNQLLAMGDDAIGDYLALVLLINDPAGATAVTLSYEIEYSSPQ